MKVWPRAIDRVMEGASVFFVFVCPTFLAMFVRTDVRMRA